MTRQFNATVSQKGLEYGWDLFGLLAAQFDEVMSNLTPPPGLIRWQGEAIPMGGTSVEDQMYAVTGREIPWEAII